MNCCFGPPTDMRCVCPSQAYVSGLPPETKLPVAELLCNEHVTLAEMRVCLRTIAKTVTGQVVALLLLGLLFVQRAPLCVCVCECVCVCVF